MHESAPVTCQFHANHALLPEGWARDVRIDCADGQIVAVTANAVAPEGAQRMGAVVPGLGNLHSHAFQRALAGLTETGGASGDSFWSWRTLMYHFVERLQPDAVQAIAELAYMEMLEAGFTRVGEFHYLHHAPDGRAYADPAEMAARIAAAASATGIGLTLLPVFYAHSDFGGAPPLPQQRRFVHDLEHFQRLLDRCRHVLADLPDAVLGIAPHSLRAVTAEELWGLADAADGPIHIHIAEQQREVDACTAWCGQRPLTWLLDHAPVDARWCLVHATHADGEELRRIAASGAVVGLCPITEANLGDGVFPMHEFIRAGGRFGVGSDSNVLISAADELRLLEYGQRLTRHGRNVLAPDGASSGGWLYRSALTGAAQALGVMPGLAVGASADLVELDTSHPALAARSGDALMDGWLFAAASGAVRSVWRGACQVVRDGRHCQREAICAHYRMHLQNLIA